MGASLRSMSARYNEGICVDPPHHLNLPAHSQIRRTQSFPSHYLLKSFFADWCDCVFLASSLSNMLKRLFSIIKVFSLNSILELQLQVRCVTTFLLLNIFFSHFSQLLFLCFFILYCLPVLLVIF